MKLFWSKYKRLIWVAAAIIFIAALFLIKNKTLFENTKKYFGLNQQSSLSYNSATVEDLVNLDTDGDGVPNWEENLVGLDPTKKETTPGTPDNIAIEKLRKAETNNASGVTNADAQGGKNLTQTEKFSREFLATVNALAQSGALDKNGNIDQATIDKISDNLAENVKNIQPEKVYTFSDIKISNDNSKSSINKYYISLTKITSKLRGKYDVISVLQKFVGDGNTPDPSVLPELDPIIKEANDLKNGMLAMTVPQFLSVMHLNVINDLERVTENLNQIEQYNTDPIISFSGMSNFTDNEANYEDATQMLLNTINAKLNN